MLAFVLISTLLATSLAKDRSPEARKPVAESLPASYYGHDHYQIHGNADVDTVSVVSDDALETSLPINHQPLSTSSQYHHRFHNSFKIKVAPFIPVVGFQALEAALPVHQSAITSAFKVAPVAELHSVKAVSQPLATFSQSRSQIHNRAFHLLPQYSQVFVPDYAGILQSYIPGQLQVSHYYPTISQGYEDRPHIQQIHGGENQEFQAAVSDVQEDQSQNPKADSPKSDDEEVVNDSVSVDSA